MTIRLWNIIGIGLASIVVGLGPVLHSGWADDGRDEHGARVAEDGRGYGYGRDNVAAASHYLRHLLKHTREIRLTTDQANKLRMIQLDLNRARFRDEAEIEVSELELQSLLENDTTDLGPIESKLKLIEDLEKELRLTAIKAEREARLMLTPEQRSMWEAEQSKGGQ